MKQWKLFSFCNTTVALSNRYSEACRNLGSAEWRSLVSAVIDCRPRHWQNGVRLSKAVVFILCYVMIYDVHPSFHLSVNFSIPNKANNFPTMKLKLGGKKSLLCETAYIVWWYSQIYFPSIIENQGLISDNYFLPNSSSPGQILVESTLRMCNSVCCFGFTSFRTLNYTESFIELIWNRCR